MKRFTFTPSRLQDVSPVYCGSDIFRKLVNERLLKRYSSISVVIDAKVHDLYAGELQRDLLDKSSVYRFPRGERFKSEARLVQLLRWLYEREADRDSLVLGIGGGVVTDIAGLAVSCYKRGIAYIAVPTTLLGQIDAAIGGKTAVNLRATKNVIGTFCVPEMVICDSQFLTSLRREQIKDGIIEALKVFVVNEEKLFLHYAPQVKTLVKGTGLNPLIADAVRSKLAVVNADPFEKGVRKILNFGHTAGHAAEAITGWSHGKAVAFGILVALTLSRRLARLSVADADLIRTCICEIYDRFDAPDLSPTHCWEKIKQDKKRSGDNISFVLLTRPGRYKIRAVSFHEFRSAFAETLESLKR